MWWGRGGRGGECTVGAEFLAAAVCPGGATGYYYEVEVLAAEGRFYVGFAGTNFGLQCTIVGNDACSWSFYMRDGNGFHG